MNSKKIKNTKTGNQKSGSKSLFGLVVFVSALGSGCAYDPVSEMDSDGDRVDYLVSERLVLSSYPEKIRRLTLLEGAVLSTNGRKLKLDVEEIVSFGGVIDTTPQFPNPEPGNDGASGGLLHLVAQRGRGNLVILAGGQAGSKGAQGVTGPSGARGANGNDGAVGSRADCLFSAMSLFARHPDSPGRCPRTTYCERQTGDGSSGAQGGPGQPGLPGGKGGDSSPILFELEDPSELQVSMQAIAGQGGEGGPGGEGGHGGPGGAPGQRDRGKHCRVASHGPQGPSGSPGAHGNSGAAGREMPICLRLGGAQIGDCINFNELTRRGTQ